MFKLTADERLIRWRKFRKNLDALTLYDASAATVQLWGSCPFSPYYLDIGKPETWPDAWTLLHENWYCDIAKALGMIYTLCYTKHAPNVELHVHHDPINNYDYNLVWVNDGEIVLNLVAGEVVNKEHINKEWELIKCFKKADLKLDNY